MKGDTNPSLCSARTSPLSTKIKLGDAADPASRTMRLPVAFTVPLGLCTPLSFIVPFLRVNVTVVFLVGGTIIWALGLADFALPAKDHDRW